MKITSHISRLLALAMLLSHLCMASFAHANVGEDAVREVGTLIGEERWQEAFDTAMKAPVSEATRSSLLGLIHMRRGAHREALEEFERALRLGPRRDTIFLYMAWSHYSLGDQDEALASLDHVERSQARAPLYWLLRGRLGRDAGRPSLAYADLLRGHRRFPQERAIARELGFLLIEFGALHSARRVLLPTLLREDAQTAQVWADGTRIMQALADRGLEDEALFYAEVLRGLRPDDASLLDALSGHLHARAGRHITAAKLFERATFRGEESFAFEAADQHRVAGMSDAALRWNGRVASADKRLTQRFLILTEARRWSRAAITGAKLNEAGALSSAPSRYRYGVSLILGLRDIEGARAQARALDDAKMADRLTDLITRCERDLARCS